MSQVQRRKLMLELYGRSSTVHLFSESRKTEWSLDEVLGRYFCETLVLFIIPTIRDYRLLPSSGACFPAR